MSVPSLNVTTTCDRPNLEMERTCSSAGRPDSACSTGKVMRCSTSSGARAGAVVLICTCTGVVSGKASTSSRRSDSTPTTASASTPTTTRTRCRSEKSITQLSTGNPFREARRPHGPSVVAVRSPRAEVVLEQLRPQHAAALGHHHLAGQQAGNDLGVAAVDGAGPHRARVEQLGRALGEVALVAHEDDAAVALPLHRLAGHDDGLFLLPKDDAPRAEGVVAQPPRRVGQVGAHADG